VWLALGSNLGDRLAGLRAGLDGLVAGGVAIDEVSSVYETPPWGTEDLDEPQPSFANAAASGRTDLDPYDLLALCKRIEAAAGRDLEARRNSARPIDIDVLLIDGEVIDAPDLRVPHARMHERAFVLVPLTDIAPEVEHPLLRQTIVELLREVDRGGVELLEGSGWWVPSSDEVDR